jgi:hypothetical protein
VPLMKLLLTGSTTVPANSCSTSYETLRITSLVPWLHSTTGGRWRRSVPPESAERFRRDGRHGRRRAGAAPRLALDQTSRLRRHPAISRARPQTLRDRVHIPAKITTTGSRVRIQLDATTLLRDHYRCLRLDATEARHHLNDSLCPLTTRAGHQQTPSRQRGPRTKPKLLLGPRHTQTTESQTHTANHACTHRRMKHRG